MGLARISIIGLLICFFTAGANVASASTVQTDTPYSKAPALAKFEGDWLYQSDSVTFRLKLKLYPKVYSPFEKSYNDYMFGWYSFEKRSGDSILTEETLTRYDSSRNPMVVFFEKGSDADYDAINLFPSMVAWDRDNGDIVLLFKRAPKNNGPHLNMLATLSSLSDTSITGVFKPSDNIGFNHEMDYMVAYWEQFRFPFKMKLTKITSRN